MNMYGNGNFFRCHGWKGYCGIPGVCELIYDILPVMIAQICEEGWAHIMCFLLLSYYFETEYD